MTTMEVKSIFKTSGALSARSMLTSLAIHVLVLGVADARAGASAASQRAPQAKRLDIVFYRPPEIAIPPRRGPASDAASERLRPGPHRGRLHPR